MDIFFVMKGVAASKANSRQLVMLDDKPASIKSKPARAFEAGALLQIPIECRVQLTCDVAVTLKIYYPNKRSDLDESVVLDVMQNRYKRKFGETFCIQRGVYENDRQVKEKHVFWYLDRENPRVEVLVRPMVVAEQAGLFNLEEVQPVGRPSDKALAIAQVAADAAFRRPRAAMEERKADIPGAPDGQPF